MKIASFGDSVHLRQQHACFFRRYSVNRFEFMFRKVLNGYDCIISVDLTLLGKKAS